jgi:hypothetical protein
MDGPNAVPEPMPRSLVRHSFTRFASFAALALSMGGCAHWVAEPTPAAALTGHGHRLVRVTTTQGTRLVLRDPQVSRDTLFGWAQAADLRGGGRTTLPVACITRVERRVSEGKPLAAAAFVAVTVFTLVVRP